MPVYDYVCASCGQRTEVIHGIEAPGPRFCPACGAEGTLRKAFVAPTVHFKGSGWAKKDRSAATRSRSKPATDGADGGSTDGSTSKAGDDAGGTSKSDATVGSGPGASDKAAGSSPAEG